MTVFRITVTVIQTSWTISVSRTGWWIFVTSVVVSINSWCVDLCLIDGIDSNICSYCEMTVECMSEHWLTGTFCSSITIPRCGAHYNTRPAWLQLRIVATTSANQYILFRHLSGMVIIWNRIMECYVCPTYNMWAWFPSNRWRQESSRVTK